MSNRRMFSQDIVDSDAFLEMPQTTQLLYFHLAMRADDDGFVNPKKIIKIIGSSEDDMKVLLTKRFLLTFETGVVVIKHWLIHNLIRADLYKETLYKKEKSILGLNENGAYTELREGVSELKKIEAPKWLKIRRGEERTANVPQTALRIGKDRIGKDRIVISKNTFLQGKQWNEIVDMWKPINDLFEDFYSNKTERGALDHLAQKIGIEKLKNAIYFIEQCLGDEFAPVITKPTELKRKYGQLQKYYKKIKNNGKH